MRRKKPALSALAVVAALAAVVVAIALVMHKDTPAPASERDVARTATKPQFPPLPRRSALQPPPEAAPPARVVENQDRPALCDGCLDERAVLDVVEAYLRHLDPVHLQGGIWAHPLADVAPETPGLVGGLPKLPPGLLDAPEFNPFGMTVDTRSYPVETTWLVWLQTGWVPRRAIEQRIRRVRETTIGEMRARATSPIAALETTLEALEEALEEAWPGTVVEDAFPLQESSGDLPEVALSWPPIKKEVFVAVDGRTGELRPHGIFQRTSEGMSQPYPPHHQQALDAARQRANYWLRNERQARSP